MKRTLISVVFVLGMVLLGSSIVAAQSSSVAGEWDASYDTPGGPKPFKLVFKVDGEKLSGTVIRNDGELPLSGTVKGDAISFDYTITYNGHDLSLYFAGKVTGDTMGGTVSFGGNGDGEWTAKRAAVKPKNE